MVLTRFMITPTEEPRIDDLLAIFLKRCGLAVLDFPHYFLAGSVEFHRHRSRSLGHLRRGLEHLAERGVARVAGDLLLRKLLRELLRKLLALDVFQFEHPLHCFPSHSQSSFIWRKVSRHFSQVTRRSSPVTLTRLGGVRCPPFPNLEPFHS